MKANDQASRAIGSKRPFQRLGVAAAAFGASAAFALVAAGVSAQSTPAQPAPSPPQAAAPAGNSGGVENLFKRIDVNADGFISKAEFDKADPNMAKDFDKYDTDKDGKLSMAEFDAMMKALRN